MIRRRARIGLVELYVELPQDKPAASVFSLLQATLRRGREDRKRQVLSILNEDALRDVEVLVFPGWTLVGDSLPDDVVDACGNRIVAIEVLDEGLESRASFSKGATGKGRAQASGKAGGKAAGERTGELPWTTYVVAGGRKVVPGVKQLIISGDEARDETRVHALLAVLPSERTFTDRRFGTVGLMVCGEVNIAPADRRGELPKGFPELDLILNPSHTRSPLDAMRRKRACLAQGGILACTANTHSAWTRKLASGEVVRGSASYQAASFFGDRAPAPEVVALGGGSRALIIESPSAVLSKTMEDPRAPLA